MRRVPSIAKRPEIIVPPDFEGKEDRLRVAAVGFYERDVNSPPLIVKAGGKPYEERPPPKIEPETKLREEKRLNRLFIALGVLATVGVADVIMSKAGSSSKNPKKP